MRIDPAHIVGTGGALGALLRYLLGQWIDADTFPVATVAVNVIGSFVLAALTFAGSSETVVLLLGTGACGSFTTFSSFSVQTVRLWETGDRKRALCNAVGTLLGATGAIGLAWVAVGQ
ncbi:fluoride efflux transporter CrcB [Halocatena pleomorpha]|uniref:Fluoride-specific ion channel FluC n=1 Tax=Halocatena pleomorpha TaxID=1785090 RepID=A0A3P3RBZ4_9EURY|nr:fluoride efflux transporter CrcB [Halocatena pleomorpha]RRJ30986.1 fluoride efflux transporter CrcB [Halocatena pleomorpha]